MAIKVAAMIVTEMMVRMLNQKDFCGVWSSRYYKGLEVGRKVLESGHGYFSTDRLRALHMGACLGTYFYGDYVEA